MLGLGLDWFICLLVNKQYTTAINMFLPFTVIASFRETVKNIDSTGGVTKLNLVIILLTNIFYNSLFVNTNSILP